MLHSILEIAVVYAAVSLLKGPFSIWKVAPPVSRIVLRESGFHVGNFRESEPIELSITMLLVLDETS